LLIDYLKLWSPGMAPIFGTYHTSKRSQSI